MAGYRVSLVGHMDVWKLPPNGGLPNEVVQLHNVDAESDAQLNSFIDDRMADIVGSGAMKVYVDPSSRKIGKIEPWITVPLHMLTHISFRIKLLTGELPVYNKAEGKSVLPSGEDAKVQ